LVTSYRKSIARRGKVVLGTDDEPQTCPPVAAGSKERLTTLDRDLVGRARRTATQLVDVARLPRPPEEVRAAARGPARSATAPRAVGSEELDVTVTEGTRVRRAPKAATHVLAVVLGTQ